MADRISIAWTDLQVDAMTEVLNLGMGQACSSMSRMIGEIVNHGVPVFTILAPEELSRKLDREYPDGRCLVRQDFQGSFDGRAIFLLSSGKMALMSRATQVRNSRPDGCEQQVDDRDAVCEIGNVFLGACLASLSGSLDARLKLAPPELDEEGSFNAICEGLPELDHRRTNLCCCAGFHTSGSDINGLMILIFGQPSAEGVHHHIGEYIHRVMG